MTGKSECVEARAEFTRDGHKHVFYVFERQRLKAKGSTDMSQRIHASVSGRMVDAAENNIEESEGLLCKSVIVLNQA